MQIDFFLLWDNFRDNIFRFGTLFCQFLSKKPMFFCLGRGVFLSKFWAFSTYPYLGCTSKGENSPPWYWYVVETAAPVYPVATTTTYDRSRSRPADEEVSFPSSFTSTFFGSTFASAFAVTGCGIEIFSRSSSRSILEIKPTSSLPGRSMRPQMSSSINRGAVAPRI